MKKFDLMFTYKWSVVLKRSDDLFVEMKKVRKKTKFKVSWAFLNQIKFHEKRNKK